MITLSRLLLLLCGLVLSVTQTLALTPQIATRAGSNFAIDSDGGLVGWGDDSAGQLGQGRLLQSSVPLLVGSGFTAAPSQPGQQTIAAGEGHTVAVKTDGTLWAWGDNNDGQLGDGTDLQRNRPVLIGNGYRAVAAGVFHTVALKTDGTLWTWGRNALGELGIGTTTLRQNSPVQIGTGYTAIWAGADHNFARKEDGTLWAWGRNDFGQLGDGTTTMRTRPVQVGSDYSAVSAGIGHTLALKADGTLWAWGWNYFGQLGDGTFADRYTPAQIGSDYGAITAYGNSSSALKTDGTLWVWGGYRSSEQTTPVQIGSGYSDVAPGEQDAIALKPDGTLWAWYNYTFRAFGGDAVQIGGGYSVIASGPKHSLAVKSDGTLWAWGDNSFSQLGDGAIASRANPVHIGADFKTIAVGGAGGEFGRNTTHAVAVKTDGTLWTWGNSTWFQLGDGKQTSRSSPVQVGTGYATATAGYGFTLAVRSDGTLWAWGSNWSGQLGDGTTNERQDPVQVGSGYSTVAAGGEKSAFYTVALKTDGTLWAWGNNYFGQLGIGTTSCDSCADPSPVQVGSGYSAVAAGYYHAVAVKTDGSLWAWGGNDAGQLGDGTQTSRSSPVQIGSGYLAVAAGADHTVALKIDGTVWSWGGNWYGQLGDGTWASRSVPTQVPGLTGVIAVAAGEYGSLAVKSDGSILAWGDNRSSQIGDGTFAERRSPVLVVNTNADGFLNLKPGTVFEVPPALRVPFFVVSSGGITDTSASVNTTAKFNAADLDKPGAVFVTATVPPGTLVPVQSAMSAPGASASASFAITGSNSFVLIQLTSSGWQPLVNGQLIPYASGVLGDQLAAQTILYNADTTNLKGAEFCLGYGTSADQMVVAGAMRTVVTIPDPNATSGGTASCIVVASMTTTTTTTAPATTTTTTVASATTTTQSPFATRGFTQGWNLVGNSSDAPIDVTNTFSDTNIFTTVWKWIAAQSAWAFHAPSLASQGGTALADYVASKGYQLLITIAGGEGFWVNAKQAGSVNVPKGNAISVATLGPTLIKGWNLVSLGETATPKQFCDAQSGGLTTLWAWDATNTAWYFYAPSLDASNGLSTYITSKGYLDFTTANKTLGPGVGFWLNKP